MPLANFAGWLLVSWAIIGAFLLLERAVLRRQLGPWRSAPADAVSGAALFAGVVAFNVAVAFAIGEPAIGLAGAGWGVLMLGGVARRGSFCSTGFGRLRRGWTPPIRRRRRYSQSENT